jgi:hypothetical protein
MVHKTVFVGYSYEGEILKEMVFYMLPEGHSTHEHIFNTVEKFLKPLPLYNCINVCADGATPLTS